MSRDDIIRMARMVFDVETDSRGRETFSSDNYAIERFAHLVYKSVFRDANIAASRTILDAAVLQEREACAKVCELMEQQAEGTECCKWPTPIDCAAAIRERSNP